MKAAILYSPGEIRVEERAVPVVNSKEVLVKVKAAAICGSDVRVYKGEKKAVLPRIIGHEFSGEVVKVGKNVRRIQKGDRVTMEPVISCGSCFNCSRGRTNICIDRRVIGYNYDGAFAQYIRIPEAGILNLCSIPDNISYEKAALAEPFAACLNGVNRVQLHHGDTMAIIGAGPIGLVHLQLAKAIGASKILVSDPFPKRLMLAKKFGADYIVNPKEKNLAEFVEYITAGVGFDIVVISVGIPQLIIEAIAIAKKGGVVNIFAGCPPHSKVELDPNIIHYGEVILTGSESSTVNQVKEILSMMTSHRIDPESLITHRLPLESIVQALKVKTEMDGLKPIIVP